MLEYWVEHYHQVAHRYDTYWRTQSSIQIQAEIRARIERRFCLPETKKAHSKIVAKFSGVWKRKRSVQAVGEQDRVNTEREGAMGRMMEMLADASNIGAMGDLVDGASGVGTAAGEEGEV